MAISNNMRFTVFERDGFKCQYCGKSSPDALLEIDHIIAVSLGGGDNIDNLISSCSECNSGKSGKLIKEAESNKDIKRRLGHLSKRVELLRKCNKMVNEVIDSTEDIVWEIVIHWCKNTGKKKDEENKWSASGILINTIRGLITQNSVDMVIDAVNITVARYGSSDDENVAIKYLYGVIRNKKDDERDK